MNENPLLKRLMKTEKKDVMHTSGYAEAQNAGNFGSSSAESFAKRKEIDEHRKTIKGYRDSKIANETRGGYEERRKDLAAKVEKEQGENATYNETQKTREYQKWTDEGSGRANLNRTQITTEARKRQGGLTNVNRRTMIREGAKKRFGGLSVKEQGRAPSRKNPGISRGI